MTEPPLGFGGDDFLGIQPDATPYLDDELVTNFTTINITKGPTNLPISASTVTEAFSSSNRLFTHLTQVYAVERKTKAATPMTTMPTAQTFNSSERITRSRTKQARQQRQPQLQQPPQSQQPDQYSPVMVSAVPPNVGTDYSFHAWYYVVAKVAFGSPSDQLYDVYLDAGSSLSIASKQWLTAAYPDYTARTRAKPVSIGGVGANKSWSTEYVILDLLFPGAHDQKPAWAKVTHEVHLLNTLAANLIVGIDILGPQYFELNIAKKSAYIAAPACKVHIAIDPSMRPNPA